MINRVTITGADDSIDPINLVQLSLKYPFVEWGILVSKKIMGNHRFPSQRWLQGLEKTRYTDLPDMKLSMHVCGMWVRQLLLGQVDLQQEIGEPLYHIFQRIQINTHAEKHDYNAKGFEHLQILGVAKVFIFQYDGVNTELLQMASDYNIRHSALFDLSHGIGILPEQWPDLLPNTKCGYAGGLSPENLEQQIQRIEQKAGDTEVWIDMETHVRSNMDQQFDLRKVEKCLQIASKYIR